MTGDGCEVWIVALPGQLSESEESDKGLVSDSNRGSLPELLSDLAGEAADAWTVEPTGWLITGSDRLVARADIVFGARGVEENWFFGGLAWSEL